jgi:regulator of protease activity HflC (stomatin/prohibitin superfamily)
MHRADKRSELAAVVGFTLQAFLFGFFLILFKVNNSAGTFAESWHFLAGAGIWILIFIELYQQRLAWQQRVEVEELERQRLGRVGGSESVFEQMRVDEELPMEQRLKFIKKWFIPSLSIITAGLLLLFSARLIPGWWPMQWVTDAAEMTMKNQAPTLIIIAGVSLVCFLTSRYCLGLSRTPGWRLMRAGANYMMGNALMCLVLAVVLGLSYYDIKMPEVVLARVIPGLMALLAVEIVLNLVLDMYRPRVTGEEYRPSYESRFLGLFCEPEGVMRSIAHTIDYQFGFKVSETWFYQLLQQAIFPLILFALITLYLLSIVVVVRPGEQAIISRFGDKPKAVLNEGAHLKMPWPVETATLFKVDEVRQKVIGFSGDSSIFNPEDRSPVLWTVKHVTGDEFQLLVASKEFNDESKKNVQTETAPATQPADSDDQHLSPVNIISGTVVLNYHIRYDDKGSGLLNYVTNFEDPDAILESVAYRQLTQFVASVDPMAMMTKDRDLATAHLQKSIQEELDKRNTGIELVRVAMIGLHPPVEIAGAYEQAINARQERESMIWMAKGIANMRVPMADAFAGETLSIAESKRYSKVVIEQANAQRFGNQLESFQIAPDVFYLRNYLDVLVQSTANVRKYILATENAKKLYLDVDDKEKISSGLLGLGEELAK